MIKKNSLSKPGSHTYASRRAPTPAWLVPAIFVCALPIALTYIFLMRKSGLAIGFTVPLAGLMAVVGIVVESGTGSGREWMVTVALFTFFWTLYGATRPLAATPFNEQVRLAEAILHGHLWVNVPTWMEAVRYRGHSYMMHPPLPAILLLPVVALRGLTTDQITFSVLIGALDVALAWHLLGRFRLDCASQLWLTLFFGAGTIVWFDATRGTTWSLPLIMCVAPTLCALGELFGSARPWLVGLFAGAAALARYDLFAVWPLYAAALALRGRKPRELVALLPGFIVAAAVYIAYNLARFGTPWDLAPWLFYRLDPAGLRDHPGLPGPFALRNIPSNLYTLLFMGPDFDARFPYFHPSFRGQALIFTSPAFILALRAQLRRPLVALMWLSCLLASVGVLTFYANGTVQFGPRFYIQIFPFLLCLMAMGMPRRMDQLSLVLILLSILLVGGGMWDIARSGFAG
jgi:hypothetical protein